MVNVKKQIERLEEDIEIEEKTVTIISLNDFQKEILIDLLSTEYESLVKQSIQLGHENEETIHLINQIDSIKKIIENIEK